MGNNNGTASLFVQILPIFSGFSILFFSTITTYTSMHNMEMMKCLAKSSNNILAFARVVPIRSCKYNNNHTPMHKANIDAAKDNHAVFDQEFLCIFLIFLFHYFWIFYVEKTLFLMRGVACLGSSRRRHPHAFPCIDIPSLPYISHISNGTKTNGERRRSWRLVNFSSAIDGSA